MNNSVTVPPLDVLRNRGVQIKVHVLEEVDGELRRKMNGEEYVFEQVWVTFNNWNLANLEEKEPAGFGSTTSWQWEMGNRLTRSVLKTFALMNDKYTVNDDKERVPDIRWASLRLMDNETTYVGIALTNAMYIANGMDPDAVGEVMKASLREAEKDLQDGADTARKQLAEHSQQESEITATTPTDQSPSLLDSDGSSTGVPSDEVLESTGN